MRVTRFGNRRRFGATPRRPHQPWRWTPTWQARLRWLGACAALAGLGLGLYGAGQKLLDPQLFPLRHVHIQGELHYLRRDDLQGLVQDVLGRNFFALETEVVHQGFADAPWVETVTVRRSWPDSLVVQLRERVPFGVWGENEMVDMNGRRFRPPAIPAGRNWPHLDGPAGHEALLIRVWDQAGTLLAEAGLRIRRLVQDQRRAWWITLDNGMEISLGRNNFEPRLRRLVAVWPTLAGRGHEIAAVDLRYVNGFAVRWSNG